MIKGKTFFKMKNEVLAIDVGSVTISIVLLSRDKEILQSAYDFHEGRIAPKLMEMLSSFELKDVCGTAATSSTPFFQFGKATPQSNSIA